MFYSNSEGLRDILSEEVANYGPADAPARERVVVQRSPSVLRAVLRASMRSDLSI